VFREGEQGEIVKLLAESPVAVTEDVRHLPSRKAPFRIGWRAVLLLAASAAVLLLLYVGDREQNASTAPKTSDVSALQALDLVGCMPGRLPDFWEAQAPSKALEVRVLTYNLFWWNLFGIRHGNGGSASRLIAASGPFDMMGFQECEDVARVLNDAGLSGQYGFFAGDGSKTSAICMAYRRSSWLLLGQGLSYVAWDKLGNRAAQWMRLQHIPSGQKVFFANHHGPLPINSGGRCGGPTTAYNLLQLIAAHARFGDMLILVGDFNANGASATVQHVQWRLRKVYAGAMGGGIDNVFSNINTKTTTITRNLGNGGSDHDALSVVFKVSGPARPWWWPWPLPMFF